MVVTAFATLFAAFFGAWYAFKKQNQHEDLKQVRRNVEAANRAIFTVHTLWEIQKSYQQQAAPSLEHRIACWLLLDPTPIINFGRTRFDVEHLDFLLSSQHVSVFRDLLQMERRYEIFRQLIERRNELVLN